MNDYSRLLPYSSLEAHLGTDSRVSMVYRGEGNEFRRMWLCGCQAVYRDTVRHTARWSPCRQHAAGLPPNGTRPPSADAVPNSLSAASRRTGPQYLLLDEHLDVLAASDGEEMPRLIREAVRTQPLWLPDAPSVVPLDDDTFIRVIPLAGTAPRKTLIFFESVRGRGGLRALAKRFDLTNREIEVLRLLISSKSNSEIAQELLIAESTAGDHVKNILRKTKSTRRSQIIAKLFDSSD
jgi:DNA-binding CsgD family transcriptional regulator